MVYRTYRCNDSNQSYWDERWLNAEVDTGKINDSKYPGKYANEAISIGGGPILELGCGLGRLLINYHNNGFDITGVDLSEVAIKKIKEKFPDIDARVVDVFNLSQLNAKFYTVLAFGVYHNFSDVSQIESALFETKKIMHTNAILCASFRLDSISNRVNDLMRDNFFVQYRKWIDKEKNSLHTNIITRINLFFKFFYKKKSFHKINMKEKELEKIFNSTGLDIVKVYYVENMPILYRFKIFRHKLNKNFCEQRSREESYRLSTLGKFSSKCINFFMGKSYYTTLCIICKKV